MVLRVRIIGLEGWLRSLRRCNDDAYKSDFIFSNCGRIQYRINTPLYAPFVDRHALQDKARDDGSDYFINGNWY